MTHKIYPINSTNFHLRTAQEVFDQVAGHLLTQGKKSTAPSISGQSWVCKYRTTNGLACAAGCLLSDLNDEQIKCIEGASWHNAIKDLKLPTTHVGLIEELQHIHDTAPEDNAPAAIATLSVWEYKLVALADNFGLVYSKSTILEKMHNYENSISTRS